MLRRAEKRGGRLESLLLLPLLLRWAGDGDGDGGGDGDGDGDGDGATNDDEKT